MTAPRAVTDSDFEQEVLEADTPVLVDFWAEWCAPCKMVAPVLEDLAEEYDGKIKFVKVDTEENLDTTARFGIMSIPTLLVFKGGQQVDQMVGAQPKRELKRHLEEVLA